MKSVCFSISGFNNFKTDATPLDDLRVFFKFKKRAAFMHAAMQVWRVHRACQLARVHAKYLIHEMSKSVLHGELGFC